MVSVSVVIPTYNECEIIKQQVQRILDVTPNLLEVIVVDDDSPDRTWDIVEKLGVVDKRVRLLRRLNSRGLASAIYDGVSSARGDVVLWLDCDHDPSKELITNLISSIKGGSDVCIASRYIKGGRELREPIQRFASRAINLFASVVLSSSIHDYSTGYVATKKIVFDEIGWDKRGYGEYCIEFLFKALKRGFIVEEVPFVCTVRELGESKTNISFIKLIKFGLDYVIKIVSIRFGG